jgi:hypothetical protein
VAGAAVCSSSVTLAPPIAAGCWSSTSLSARARLRTRIGVNLIVMPWNTDDLSRIEAAQELEIAPQRRDGSLRKAVPIWVVRAGDDLYVRAAYGSGSGWHRVARASHAARVRAGGVEKDVTIEDADAAVYDQVDAAYRSKYGRYPRIVDGITDDQARSSTLRLVPRS